MVLIGLMAIKESGKSTAADYLVNKYGFIERPLALCLKLALKEIFLLSDDQLFGSQTIKETPDPRWKNCTPRTMFQYIGTDLFREQLNNIMPGINNDVFIEHFKLWYGEHLKLYPDSCVVISDVRFQNEVDYIQSVGGYVIKIDRQEITNSDKHESESGIQKIISCDFFINNDGTDNYYKLLSKIIEPLIGV